MSQALSDNKPTAIEDASEALGSTFTDDAIRAAFPWVLIVMTASVIAVAIGIIMPAVEYHARGEIRATVAIGCGAVSILAAWVFVHLFVTSCVSRFKRKP